ncbi:unnamed protein product [Amaranthus hypochondriacus]
MVPTLNLIQISTFEALHLASQVLIMFLYLKAVVPSANLLLTNSSSDIVAGCSSICSSTAISTKMLNCYGIDCCHANLNTFHLDYYTIDVLNNATSSSRICNVAAGLINGSFLSNFVGNLSRLRKYSTVVLDWKVEYAAHKSPFPHSSCYDNTITNVQKCDCDFNYEGNPHIPDGCQLVRGCQGCKHHCSYNDSFITGSGTPFYCEKRRFFNRASIIGKCSLEFCKNRLNAS